MLRNLKISNTKFNGVEYQPRKNSLNKFFALALKMQRAYSDYEDVYVDKELIKEVLRAETEKDAETYGIAIEKLLKQRFMCYELFLTCDIHGEYSVVNAENLCKLMFDSCDINHSQDRNDAEFSEYLDFMVGLLRDFFLNYNPISNIGSLLADSVKTTQSETNSQATNLAE